jgi:hypothetical protein
MRTQVFLTFLCVVLLQAQPAPVRTYGNDKYAYQVEYSPSLLIAKGESDAGDGQIFTSPDGKIEVRVWGQFNVLEETLASKLAAALRRDGLEKAEGVYKVLKPGWFVYSGVTRNGTRIVYEKTILSSDTFKTIRFEYPVSEKVRGDALVKTMVPTFR